MGQISPFTRFASSALAVAAAAVAAPSQAAEVEHISLGDGIELIAIHGEIQSGDEDKFRRLSVQYDDAAVALASDGGALHAAIEIGKMIRLKEYPTFVMDGDQCTSACALIWVAGSKRFLAPKGRVGFHASYRDDGGRKVETGLGNALVGRYLTLLNLPEKAVLFATAAPPDRVLWLTSATMKDAGIEFEVFSDEPTPPPIVRTNVAPPPVITPRARESATTSSGSDTEIFTEVAHWTVAVDRTLNEGCFLSSRFTNNTAFRIGIDSTRERQYYILLGNPAWASLKKGASYNLTFKFDDKSPWEAESQVVEVGGGLFLMVYFTDSAFWDEFVRFNGLRVYKDGVYVTGITLAKTRAAFEELVSCQKVRLAARKARDPFEQ